MIYILAPYSLEINTTSHNRILSFYRAIKQKGLAVKVIYPGEAWDKKWFIGQVKESATLADNKDFIQIIPKLNFLERLAFRSPVAEKSWLVWLLVSKLFYFLHRRDIYYPGKSLLDFFGESHLAADDILIASGPAFSLHNAAIDLAKKYQCKLMLDYRDPWTFGYPPLEGNRLFFWLSRKMERRSELEGLKLSKWISCVQESAINYFPAGFREKIRVIRNGANLSLIEAGEIVDRPPKFRIVYLGTIHQSQLKEAVFFRAIRQLINERRISPDLLELVFIGASRSHALPERIAEYQLNEYVSVTKRMSVRQAMRHAYSASVLLHLRYGNISEVLTSKQADYLALQKPIFLPVSDEGELARSIREHQAGYVCHNFEECYAALEELWEKHVRGESFRIPRSEEFLYSISREHEAEKLVRLVADALQTDPSSKKEDICTSL